MRHFAFAEVDRGLAGEGGRVLARTEEWRLTPLPSSSSKGMNGLRILFPLPKSDRLFCPQGASFGTPSLLLLPERDKIERNTLSKTDRRSAEETTNMMTPFSAVVQTIAWATV